MIERIHAMVGRKECGLDLEVLKFDASLWLVLETVELKQGETPKVWARRGDLIRVFSRTSVTGSKKVYGVCDLGTARRAESVHLVSQLARAYNTTSFWITRILVICSQLDDWNQLTERQIQSIIKELHNCEGAFFGAKAWQKELALEKVIRFKDLRDRLNRRNPQGVSRALLSARNHLVDYQRINKMGLSKNARIGILVEMIHRDYKRYFDEARKLAQLGFSTYPQVSENRIDRLRESLKKLRINPWFRPAQEALRYTVLAESEYERGNRREANKILRQIPIIFSAESRLSRIVETTHRVLNLGARLDSNGCLLAASIVHPSVDMARKIAFDNRIRSYSSLAADVADALGRAETDYRDGNIRSARRELRSVEARIRGKEV